MKKVATRAKDRSDRAVGERHPGGVHRMAPRAATLVALAMLSACATAGPVPSAAASAAAPSLSQTVARFESTRAHVLSAMAEYHRPGVAIAVTREGKVIWHDEYGVTDVGSGTAVTSDTVFPVCSLSKPILLVAVMREVESLASEAGVTVAQVLDRDIEELVNGRSDARLSVRHPGWPGVKVTLRMLLAHVSGIRDDYRRLPHHVPVANPGFQYWGLGLRSALRSYLTPASAGFGLENFMPSQPGTVAAYSSIASSIAALVVERDGHSFDAMTEAELFGPLAMTHTHWRLRALGGARLARGHQWREGATRQVDPVYSEHTFYPAASLRTTAVDYARFVAALAGEHGRSMLLSRATLAEVLRPQYPAIDPGGGLVLRLGSLDGVATAGHDGQNQGLRSSMFFTVPREGEPTYGVVILTNGDAAPQGRPMESALGAEILHRARSGTLGP